MKLNPRHSISNIKEEAGGLHDGAANDLKGSETILIVEDDASLRSMLHCFLSMLGYRVLEAGDGLEGLNQFENADGGIDLILSDMSMPRMNGMQMARKLRVSDPESRILFASGSLSPELVAELGGASGYLSKPFSLFELAQLLRQMLEKPRTFHSNL